MTILFLAAYACSGLASLIYQVAWTRLLTLQMGHTTAAASTVVAAFMGGLAGGALIAGRLAPRWTRRQSLLIYAALEAIVAVAALLVPLELRALTPLLAWTYGDGAPGTLFALSRIAACLLVVLVPALALGATFPLAVRWFVRDDKRPSSAGGALYAVNTAGAAIGAILAGFVLIPAVGVSGTTLVGVIAGGAAVALVAAVLRLSRADELAPAAVETVSIAGAAPSKVSGGGRRRRGGTVHASPKVAEEAGVAERAWIAPTAFAISGFASLAYEIAWTRVVAMIVGPTTYAFAGTVAGIVVALAIGAAAGSAIAGRSRRPALWLALIAAATAMATTVASAMAGGAVPRLVAAQLMDPSVARDVLLVRHTALVSSLVVPASLGFGAMFPLGLALLGSGSTVGRYGRVYAINTAAAVAGSLTAGFIMIPRFGLQPTLTLVSGMLAIEASLVAVASHALARSRVLALTPAIAAALLMFATPRWDRELLASGVYKYAREVPQGLDADVSLKAGRLLYYREGASATVSVKERTGARSLAVDGKIDGSSVGDMLTQKALAHVPLLLHPDPRDVFVVGLGTGVTLGSALVHPIRRADVAEISPQVVEASHYFDEQNLGALGDPRTHVIVGDGRTHLQLSSRKYDVIISEPSNPWMAGVAALFTREFFEAARAHLAPGGLMCQWAHTYDISDRDLRSIVATFTAVFPQASIWLIGRGDLLLVASTHPQGIAFDTLARSWSRPGVAADLARVSARDPFAFLSLYGGGAEELARYGAGGSILTDDRMALEFSGPRAISTSALSSNAAALQALLSPDRAPAAVREALATATAAQWRDRGAMLAPADGYRTSYADFRRAVGLDPSDPAALAGLTRSAVAAGRQDDALAFLKSMSDARPRATPVLSARSKLLGAMGQFEPAIDVAGQATEIDPSDPVPLEQLASLFADLGDADRLDAAALRLRERFPTRPSAAYYTAASHFLRGQLTEALANARDAVTRDRASAPGYNLLGAIHASLHQPQPAREAFETALRLNPEDSSTYVNLGLLEMESGRASDAASRFVEALSLDPQSEAARRGLEQARRGDTR